RPSATIPAHRTGPVGRGQSLTVASVVSVRSGLGNAAGGRHVHETTARRTIEHDHVRQPYRPGERRSLDAGPQPATSPAAPFVPGAGRNARRPAAGAASVPA